MKETPPIEYYKSIIDTKGTNIFIWLDFLINYVFEKACKKVTTGLSVFNFFGWFSYIFLQKPVKSTCLCLSEMRTAKEKFYHSLPKDFNFKKAMENYHFAIIANYKLYVQHLWQFAEKFQDDLQKETQLNEGIYTSPFSFYTLTSFGYNLLGIHIQYFKLSHFKEN